MIRIDQLKLPCGSDKEELQIKIRKMLGLRKGERLTWEVVRHSLDARKRPELSDVYAVCVSLGDESRERRLAASARSPKVRFESPVRYSFPEAGEGLAELRCRPVVVGAGPAGIFCALWLARAGYRPLLIERGAPMEERTADVERFWSTGELNTESNIQFGEGGAGTYSDGKLTTGVRDKSGRIRAVLEDFVRHGAPEDICYEQLPHIGTDRLRETIVGLREELIALGGEVRFHTRLTELVIEEGQVTGLKARTQDGELVFIPAEAVVLAPGHSARDTIRMLYASGIPMTQKNFALGFRVSHPQSLIDAWSTGLSDRKEMERLGIAPTSYKLTARAKSGRGVYSFCMCPGGYVVNASSEEGRLAVNGMSDYARDSARANSAIVMTVGAAEFGGEATLDGLHFQEELERRAYETAAGRVPVEHFRDFERRACAAEGSVTAERNRGLAQRVGASEGSGTAESVRVLSPEEARELCIKGLAAEADLTRLLPPGLTEDFVEGMQSFDRVIPGFAGEEAWVIGLESRTSSPVRITRDETGQSVRGLFPCGEGAGYAGGIMSAAVDGIRTAEAVAALWKPAGDVSGLKGAEG